MSNPRSVATQDSRAICIEALQPVAVMTEVESLSPVDCLLIRRCGAYGRVTPSSYQQVVATVRQRGRWTASDALPRARGTLSAPLTHVTRDGRSTMLNETSLADVQDLYQ